jgi:hypothetical protein
MIQGTDSPPGGVAATCRRGYLSARREAEERLTHHRDTFTSAQALPRPPIFEVPCGGVGVAANGHLRGRPLRRGYAGAKMCRVRQEGLSLQTTSRTHQIEELGQPLGVTKGEGCALNGQESFFAPLHDRPTSDSIYLAEQIDAKWHSRRLPPSALQHLVDEYGQQQVEDKLRELYGFPPQDALRSAYAYLETMLKEGL